MNQKKQPINDVINNNYKSSLNEFKLLNEKIKDQDITDDEQLKFMELDIQIKVYKSLITEIIEYNRYIQTEIVRKDEFDEINDKKLYLTENDIIKIVQREKIRREDLIKMYKNAGHTKRFKNEKIALEIINNLLNGRLENLSENIEINKRPSINSIDISLFNNGASNEK